MPNSRHTSVMASPSSRRATKRRRSSITELAFHGIHTSRLQKSEKCNPCVRYEMSPMSQAAQAPVIRGFLDRSEIRHVGARRADAGAEAQFADEMPVRRGLR